MGTVRPDSLNAPDPQQGEAVNPSQTRQLVWQLVKPYRKWLAVVFAAMLLEALMGLATPWPLKFIIDHVIEKRPLPSQLHFLEGTSVMSSTSSMIGAAALTCIVLAVIGAAAGYVNSYFTENTAQHVANDIRQRLYHHLQRLSLSYYADHQVARIINTITTDVSTIQEFASQSILRMVVDLMTITGMLAVMFYLHWDFALMAVAITPFLLFFLIRFKGQAKRATRALRNEQSNLATVVQQGLESIRTVNAFGRQDLEEERLRKTSQETIHAALKARKLKAMIPVVINISISLCVAMVLWRGTDLVLRNAMTIGALTVFLAYLAKFFTPAQDLAKMTNVIAQTSVALERVQAILLADSVIPEKKGALPPRVMKGNIRFENVRFHYLPDVPVLKGCSFGVEEGQKIGICGHSGCGKSTIASLIARFYDPIAGRVLIDGTDIRDFSLQGLRGQIGFVLQDTFIFYGTIRDNIAYGRPHATDAEIIEAAKVARVHDFVMRMPQGYNTLVGERGITLSGGQRQCIGIARALVRNAPVLILDEPTASLDAEGETVVLGALEALMRGRTVVTITHRLSTLREADRIFVLNDGAIAEEGTHEALLKKGGLYAELYHMQNGIHAASGMPIYTTTPI